MTTIIFSSNNHLWHLVRAVKVVEWCSFCWPKTFGVKSKSWKRPFVCKHSAFVGHLPSDGNTLLFILDCVNTWEFHFTTLNSYGLRISYEVLIRPLEVLDKAAIQLIFSPQCPYGIPRVCSTPKSYNYPMWSMPGPVLLQLMSFPKVQNLHVPYIPSLFVPCFGTA